MENSTVPIENVMIAANCNTVINSISYNKDKSLVAYAAANSVLIMDPYHINGKIPKVLFSLRGHLDRVNGVSWISNRSLVSISADKSIIVWSYSESHDPRVPESWVSKKVFQNAHNETITYLRTYNPAENEYYILTTCAAGTMKLWQGSSIESIEYKDQLIFGKNLQEAMGLTLVGEKHLMLTIGGYDKCIHVYLIPRLEHQNSISKTFKYKFSLLGHLNSLRDFDFTEELDNHVRYMASCS
jgi:WD40 repeat protein